MSRFPVPVTLLAMLLFAGSAHCAEVGGLHPFVEHVEPPAVGRGQKTRIAIVGSRLDRAVGLWTSLPQGSLTVTAIIASNPDRTELEIETAATCPVGLYGLRLATEDGLSNLHLFAVDDLAPRAALADPQAEFPAAVAGQLGASDRYRLQVQAGQRLTFDVVASRFGHDSDPLVTIYNASGRRVAQRDNSPGLFFDTCFSHTFVDGGVHTIEVRDARFQNSPHWRYLLRIGDFPAAVTSVPSAVQPGSTTTLKLPEFGGAEIPFTLLADQPLGVAYHSIRRPSDRAGAWIPLLASPIPSVVEREPNNSGDDATVVEAIPALLHGVLDSPDDRDYFTFDLKKGERLSFRAETRTIQSSADVELRVLDASGREVQRSDDVSLPGGALEEAFITYNVGQDGKYRLLVRDVTQAGGSDFTYRVEVRHVKPRVQLLAETSAFTVPQNSFQVIPIGVTRVDYNGPITLRLEHAPAGLTLEPDTIATGANSIVCALRTTAATPVGLYAFTLSGQPAEGDSPQEAPVTVQPLVDRQFINVDLIKHALRDNQRYLPPSVRHQFALQVTPPSPFSLELTDSAIVLPRYQVAELPLSPVRQAGFDGPISFTASSGGQLGEETQGRKQVFYRFPIATAQQPQVAGTFHSRSQANEGQERVDLFATTLIGSRRVTLNRSVNLSIKPAVEVTIEPAQLVLSPGKSSKIKLVAKRLPSFTGPVTVTTNPQPGVTLPSAVVLVEGQTQAEIELHVSGETKPRRERIRFTATATVGNFQEEPRPAELDLEIKLETPPTSGK